VIVHHDGVPEVPVPVTMTVGEAAAAWLANYSSSNTRLAYGSDLRAFLAWFDDESDALEAGPVELARYRLEREASGLARSTVDRQFAALRAFYAAACELGACRANPLGARREAVPVESATGVLTSYESDSLREAATVDVRTAVLVQLLLGEGLRLSEVLALDHDDVSGGPRAKRLRVRRHGRAIDLAVDRASSRSIDRLQRAATHDDGPLLTGPTRAGRSTRLTRFGADHLLKQAAAAARIERPVSANVLRRTHVTTAQRAGVHIEDIRQRMGHRDVRTTRRYLRPGRNRSTT
jgi:site-specific recombinase XerD